MSSDEARRRLRWQCRRGMLELDLLLQGFLDKGYDALSDKERRLFQNMLEESDQLLYEWLMKKKPPTDGDFNAIIDKVRQTAATD